jgi:hypothetical protein
MSHSRTYLLMFLFLMGACRTQQSHELSAEFGRGRGEAWDYRDCKTSKPEIAEVSEEAFSLRVYVHHEASTADTKKSFVFTDENGEERSFSYAAPAGESATGLYSGQASLSYAAPEFDTKPVFLAYEKGDAGAEYVYAKTEIPQEYVDEKALKAHEVTRYSNRGDLVTVLLIRTIPVEKNKKLADAGSEPNEFLVTRLCGSGFGYQLNQREPISSDSKHFVHERKLP